VGIVWVAVFTPDEDWTVMLPDAERANFQNAGTYKYLELEQTGKNQFELPPLTIETRKENSGPVCVSVKAWFNEVTNVYDSLYYIDRERSTSTASSSAGIPRARFLTTWWRLGNSAPTGSSRGSLFPIW
jgi:hypothetical protein